ncbi:similar to Saccharomyces cerevisiae YJL048C UBX6 UBX (ubiquitin regulatory X) domain-containing protein that interacts with Cdc48p [Maudiozyma barnettii]|uniref:Similar to Saccharomyces cerevisiae YJL048C UBX6 UBX (Ubiquitin regulatory X) domain-containing protein that interacts with Cdc48p n=1 Tax=Maudiozyma barnettii TaxID=61262 RepID=A0A8H2VFG1_9SACH|nr:uncharacterized protein KABA2_04S08778 [Kazachstania barnettii]CAB4254547.1 similar to Saccharomyces cerevisiae YJL048C UBX6 UBX (ubiquitin regulatory X) domain-containing protein that interacts with Cdc48p [Kazachstania barnettii]CAD1782589.1 similar to Saccharomyces cerevisiae YJL048C UBX6 UBX (ubiquitin regulatory X) domain-containing protein that interacts with Cdc48p [Kazachstania barnettii]
MIPEFSLSNIGETTFINNVPHAFYRALQTDLPLLIIIQNQENDDDSNHVVSRKDLTIFKDKLIMMCLYYGTTELDNFKRLFPNTIISQNNDSYIILMKGSNVLNNWDLTQYSWPTIKNDLKKKFNIINESISVKFSKTQNFQLTYREKELNRIKYLINQDKLERQCENFLEPNNHNVINIKKSNSNYDITDNENAKCKLRIKLNDASTIEHTFNSCTDSLLTVKKYIEIVTGKRIPSDFAFHHVLPKRRFSDQEELQSLNSLNLKPNSALFLFKNKEYIRELRRSRDASQDFKYINICINKIKQLLQFMHLRKKETTIGTFSSTINSKYFIRKNIRPAPSYPFNDHLP